MTKAKWTRRKFINRLIDTTLLLSAASIANALLIEPNWLQISTHKLTLPRLPRAFDGYRIVQLSDLHVDKDYMLRARLKDIVAKVTALQPHLIVITGDFITHSPQPFFADALHELSFLQCTDGIWAVLGNHDHWSDAAWVRQVLRANNIYELNNQFHTLTKNQSQLHLAGFEDIWQNPQFLPKLESYAPKLHTLASSLPKQGAAILLAHEPDFADITHANGRFDLQLSGHSHGGQVNIPGYGAPVLPAFGKKYYSGIYRLDEQFTQFTHRGLGMVSPAVRFNCRPELAHLILQSPQ